MKVLLEGSSLPPQLGLQPKFPEEEADLLQCFTSLYDGSTTVE